MPLGTLPMLSDPITFLSYFDWLEAARQAEATLGMTLSPSFMSLVLGWKGYTVNNKEDLHLSLGILENIKLRLKLGRDNLKNYKQIRKDLI